MTNLVDVAALWPTEGVVKEETVAAIRDGIAQGEPLERIRTIERDGRVLVRDGNNRVRAWVEHYTAARRG